MVEIRRVACAHCGKVFKTTHPGKKYCSYKCLQQEGYLRSAKVKRNKICKYCGENFKGSAVAEFCSKECRMEYAAMKRQREKCKTCVYSCTLANGEVLCNYGAIMGISRTALGEAKRPCRLYQENSIKS